MTEKETMKLALDALELSKISVDNFRVQKSTQEAIAALKEALAQPEQERNFCPRCGKRTPDSITVHTCTPPREGT